MVRHAILGYNTDYASNEMFVRIPYRLETVRAYINRFATLKDSAISLVNRGESFQSRDNGSRLKQG